MKRDQDKTKEQLMNELAQIRQRNAELETSVISNKRVREQKELSLKVLELLNGLATEREIIREILLLIKGFSLCDAVGIRLREGEDFPYYEQDGFPNEHLVSENRLCALDQKGELIRDSQGNPILECMCGNIICGRFDPEKPFFTKGGSFWTNSTTELLASTTEEDRLARTRDICNKEGYESVALIPLRGENGHRGLLQLNDFQRNRFTPELISYYETISNSVGIILARKRAEKREKELQQELILRSRLATVGEMMAGIAHEINNPLTGVVGFSGLLMKKDIPEDIRKDVNIIYEGAQRVASITSRMLSYARQHKPERALVNINDIIETTLAMRTYAIESSNIKVTTQLDPDLPTTMAGAGKLQQVFLNIILNAEMEMITAHGGGNLLVKTERMDDTIRISFKDDGPGIAKGNIEKIFDPFFTTREVGKGTGLGLSVCYGIVTGHGGKIYAESKLGKGATFIVELPIVISPKS